MIRGIRLFRVFDISISVDYSWFLVFFLVAWSMAYGYYPYYTPGLEPKIYLIMGALSSVLLFACVLIHELSHSVISNRLGIEVKEITLFLFGGVAKLTKEPERAQDELKIAIAGPIASGALALGFYIIKLALDNFYPTLIEINSIVFYLVKINLLLLIFNMIPGLPLDGGRVLKALWWLKSGDMEESTRIAGDVGRFFSTLLILFGFLQLVTGNLAGGLWAILIGMFLMQSAKSSYRQMKVQRELEGITVADIMSTNVMTIEGSTTLDIALHDYFLKHHFVSFPVTSFERLEGIITLAHIKSSPRADWESTHVMDVMDAITEEMTLSPSDTILEAMKRMNERSVRRFAVLENGKLKGIISERDILKTLQIKELLEMR